MPTFSFTVTTEQAARVVAALCAAEGVEPSGAAAAAALRAFVVRTVRDYERGAALAAVPDPDPVTLT